jgi:3-keto-disaccharide hydrolase
MCKPIEKTKPMNDRLKTIALSLIFASISATAKEQPENWHHEPPLVTPGTGSAPPSDAIVLFDGKDQNEWIKSKIRKKNKDDEEATWSVQGKVLTIVPKQGSIQTKRSFGDMQLHIEWRAPFEEGRVGQDKGNSGIFIQNRYELQVLNSYQNKTYSNGQAASIYKQYFPLANAMRPTGQWQVYDIVYTAPRFKKDGSLKTPAYITVLHNGVLVQNHVAITGPTIGPPSYSAHGDAPITLQDHSNPVSYRNIWVRPL